MQRAIRWRSRGGEAFQLGRSTAGACRVQCGGEVLGSGCVDGDDCVVRGHPGAVGERDLGAWAQMRWLCEVQCRWVKPGRRRVDEADAECDEVVVPVVEPRFGGGAVEHSVGLVVATVHAQVKLEIRAEVRARVTPP